MNQKHRFSLSRSVSLFGLTILMLGVLSACKILPGPPLVVPEPPEDPDVGDQRLLLDFDFADGLTNQGKWGSGELQLVSYVDGEGPIVDAVNGFAGSGLSFDRSSRGGYYNTPIAERSNPAGGAADWKENEFPSEFTLSFWFRPTNPNEGGRLAWVATDSSFIDIYIAGGLVQSRLFGSTAVTPANATAIADDQWYFLALAVDGLKGEASLYLASDQGGSFSKEYVYAHADGIGFVGQSLRLGNVLSGNRPFKGFMDFVQVRTGYLESAEIEDIWQDQLAEAK